MLKKRLSKINIYVTLITLIYSILKIREIKNKNLVFDKLLNYCILMIHFLFINYHKILSKISEKDQKGSKRNEKINKNYLTSRLQVQASQELKFKRRRSVISERSKKNK